MRTGSDDSFDDKGDDDLFLSLNFFPFLRLDDGIVGEDGEDGEDETLVDVNEAAA